MTSNEYFDFEKSSAIIFNNLEDKALKVIHLGDFNSQSLSLFARNELEVNGINLGGGCVLKPQHLFLKSDKLLDIFYLSILGFMGLYCTEKFKNIVEDSEFTGIKFDKVNWIRISN